MGDITGATNVGIGSGEVFAEETSGTLEFRRLLAGSGLFIQTSGDTVRFDSNGCLIPLGTPPDGSFTDGLLELSTTTTVCNVIDQFNELLSALAPAQGYALESIDGSPEFTESGTTEFSAKIVGQASNPLNEVNYEATDTNGGTRTDIINDRTFTLTTPDINTGDGSVGWRFADQGTFNLIINESGGRS